MKKGILFIIFLVAFYFGHSQGSETFTLSNLTASYSNGNYVGDNGVTWTYVASRDESSYAITGAGIMLRRSSDNSNVTSSSVSGGIGNFTCSLKKAFTGSGNRQVELFVNGISQGTSIAFDNTTVQTFTVNGIDVSGSVIIEIRNITSKQVIVDDISWTAFSSSPTVGFAAATSSITEGDAGSTSHPVAITMNTAPAADVDVDVITNETAPVSATEDTDYTGSLTTLTFTAAGVYPMTQNFNIPITGDTDIEPNEDFLVNLSISSGSADLGITEHTVTIITDDVLPVCYTEDFVDFSDWTNGGTATDNSTSHAGNAIPCRALGGGGGGTNITSPSFSFPALLEFYQDASGGGDGKTANVEYKIGAGAWTSLHSFTVSSAGATESVDLTNVGGVDLSAQIGVSFRFSSTFSTWYLDDVVVSGASCVLPIQLLSFNAVLKNKQTHLNWQTATELNNKYMAIERSLDGKDFSEIGRINGAGTTDETQSYSFIDTKPAKGINYYRLRQVDYDGHTEYHKTVSVTFYGDEGSLVLAPTAVSNEVMLYLPTTLKENSTIRIYDMNGRLWKKAALNAGTSQHAFQLESLPAGHYTLQLIEKQTVSTVRFNKL